MKKCTNPSCGETDLAKFGYCRYTADRLQRRCKNCINTQNSTRRLAKAGPKAERVAAPPPPEAEVDHLKAAHEYVAKVKAGRDIKAEVRALAEENLRLQTQIAEMLAAQKAPDVLVYEKPKHERSDATACAIASDWHIEEPVIKEAVHGLNEYNLDIAKFRAEQFFKRTLRLTEIFARESDIKTIYLAVLGDNFSGWIHEELVANNLLAPGDAARFWKSLFISGIQYLLDNSSFNILCDMLPGNHGRMTRQMHFSDPTGTSLETFAYHAIAGKFDGNPRVELAVSDHAMRYRRFYEKFNMRLIHGYEIKYGGGVGGITIPVNKAIAQWDIAVRADLTLFGHFHQLIDGGNFIGNGSLIGYNTFAQAIKAKFEQPRQAFFLIDARNGGEKSITAPIWLD